MGEQYFMAFFSYLDQMQFMSDEQFGRVFRATMVYAQSGKMPEMDPLEMTAFMFIKWNIDKTNEKKAQTSEARSKAADAKWNKSDAKECKAMQSDAKDMQTDANGCKGLQTDAKTCKDMQSDANAMQTDANDHMKKKKEEEKEDITISNEIVSARAKRNKIPPDPDDVRTFVAEHGLNVDADAFIDYYAAQGWKLSNGVPMKDWQAAVRRWSRNEASPRAAPAGTDDRDPMLAYLDKVINGEINVPDTFGTGGESDDTGRDGGDHQGPEDGLSGFLFPLQGG